ncbi:prepilin-type N-terminal cleavage/methylation domain-containing protein [Dolichospermum lemmermannii CS-548]|uniref:prepilin-type N-terminal cleavage/methylation domain-containing protein n=1 Tax=Dolichospermum lemmermannii TaxID=54295 RepID=UPI00232C2595|nr:prepilin-type N-terminal cleavage/methylation domain-containing protein [Dolichospermum lemmermannii]MDB9435978.1 prepilin-type N-terminal cleavage/methylation domain-containing protein [Dolichospermum lemmermannii CS-548]
MIIKILKFIFKNQFKASKSLDKSAGFTLVELLVALAMSSIIITLLLEFMISVITTDSNEQIKINSEQEIQIALDYISRDLQEAIYIYDAAGINAIKPQLRYPNDDTKAPILVFWKREIPDNNSAGEDNSSLVVYYLDNSSSTIWSKAARISRWQIKKNNPGFNPFNIAQSNTVEDAMNNWQKSATAAYTTDANVLIDYVDQTKPPDSPPAATCPANTTTPPITWSKITTSNGMTGFYVCVDKANTTAKVFIRGNALARRESDPDRIKYRDEQKSYFPTANAIVQGAKSGY